MTVIEQLRPPGNVEDVGADAIGQLRAAWHDYVSGLFAGVPEFPQIYDPSTTDTPENASVHNVRWRAFPANLTRQRTTPEQRGQLADSDRDLQDEYCEWSVERNGSEITKVTFTTEVWDYYDILWEHDPQAVLRLYHTHVSDQVPLDDLAKDGRYNPNNEWNTRADRRADGPIMHLRQVNNNLFAAFALGALATVQRTRNGTKVTDQQDLIDCGRLGDPFRNSDPQIASAVNGLAATGSLLTLADPISLYIDGLEPGGIDLPAGVELADCWTPERGENGNIMRASFGLPDGRPLSEVSIHGRPIRSGGQIADNVRIRIRAISHSQGTQTPTTQPCEA